MIPKEKAMLIDVQYIEPKKCPSSAGDNKDGTLYIIWKDLDTGEKHLSITNNPVIDIYFTKKECRNHTFNKSYEFLKNLDKKRVPYKDIKNAIIEDGGPAMKERVRQIYETKNYKDLKNIMLYPYVYGADYDVRSWYRWKWLTTMKNDRPKKITKGFLDIEVDGLESDGMPNPLYNPVDLVTLIDMDKRISYTFMLHGVDNSSSVDSNRRLSEEEKIQRKEMYKNRLNQQASFRENDKEINKEVHDLFDESYGDIEYRFFYYKDERMLLKHVFQLVHQLKLDFISVWNIAFDIPYMMKRMETLGMDPAQIMCHPDFPYKQCYFKEDTKNFEVKNKSSFFRCSSYTIWLDQMVSYAAIRKGREELRSYKLNYIAQKVIGDEKLDYSDGGNIKTISYNNYKKYVIYNIKDALLQTGIEAKTQDIENIYMTATENATPYENIFKQTVKLRNVQYKDFMNDGYVPGENVNINNYEASEDEQDENSVNFEGALVGDPRLILPVGMTLYGKKTNNIFHYSIDMDMSSFYPYSIRGMNIDASTLIFKAFVDPSQYDVEGGHLKYRGITHFSKIKATTAFEIGDLGKEIMDNVQTGNVVNTMTKWFNAPTIDELEKELMDIMG